jgi:polyisoprenyl-phosphate glycosyltransferase
VEPKVVFSVVVPVYKNQESIPDLLASLDDLNSRMQGELEAVLVVDGSPDHSAELLRQELPKRSFDSQLIVLSRNFGAFAAIRAGLAHARGEAMAVMAADLQEPPELLLEMRARLASGEYEVVVGRRDGRGDPLGQRLLSGMYWWFYRRLVQPQVPRGGVDIFGCTRPFNERLLSLAEGNSTLIGLLFWLGYRRCEVGYVRRARRRGRSSWSFSRRFRYLLDSTFAFTDLPVRLLSAVGLLGMTLSLLLGAIVFVAKLIGNVAVPGYAATVLTVLFFGGLNSFGIGLLGEYVWRTFENTKRRPGYLVQTHTEFDGKGR